MLIETEVPIIHFPATKESLQRSVSVALFFLSSRSFPEHQFPVGQVYVFDWCRTFVTARFRTLLGGLHRSDDCEKCAWGFCSFMLACLDFLKQYHEKEILEGGHLNLFARKRTSGPMAGNDDQVFCTRCVNRIL